MATALRSNAREAPRAANYTVAQALAAALKRNGVEIVFGQSIPSAFFLAIPDFGIRQVGCRTENAGGTMADGYARISHRIGVVAAERPRRDPAGAAARRGAEGLGAAARDRTGPRQHDG